MEINRPRPTVKGPAEWFTGDVYIDAVAAAFRAARGPRDAGEERDA